jgi:peptide/nickel transport system substrate-binding protein
MKRRYFLAASAAAALASPAVQAGGNPKLLKFIPQADIALLDPTFAPALVR